MDCNEIRHGGGPRGQEGSGGVNPVPPAPQVLDPKRGCRLPLEPQLCILAKTRAPPI